MTTATRPLVLVFATGGTIAMRQTDRGLAIDPDFPAALEAMVSAICAPLGVDYRINHSHPHIDSANADADTAPRFAAAARSRIRTVRPRGAVVLHGTDTLAYTGARLAFEFDGLGTPVVITGSQFPHGQIDGDAFENLRLAIRASLRAGSDAPVSIAFGGSIVPAVRASKTDAEGLQAFTAARALAPDPVGTAAAPLGESEHRASRRIIGFRFVPGITAADLRASIGGAPDGLVLECYGSGTAPTDRPGITEALREICGALPVVAVTQCDRGTVDFSRYAVARRLEECGVIDGGDMTFEAALAKLGYLLDHGVTGASLGAAMRMNLVGERG